MSKRTVLPVSINIWLKFLVASLKGDPKTDAGEVEATEFRKSVLMDVPRPSDTCNLDSVDRLTLGCTEKVSANGTKRAKNAVTLIVKLVILNQR